MKLLRDRRGILAFELLISATLIVFFILFPAVTFSINYKKALIEDTKALALHYAAVQGGVTTQVRNLIISELSQKGIDGTKVLIESNTSDTNLKYKTDADPVIWLTIRYPADDDIKLLRGLLSIIGYNAGGLPFSGSGQKFYQATGYIMSEKVQE